MPKRTIFDQQIYYTDTQPEQELTLLLLHGAGGDHLDWPAELRRCPGVRVIAPDLPGHGRSALPGRDSIVGYAQFVTELVSQLGLKQVVLVGHSMGGAIAQTMAWEQPNWLRGLVLCGTAAQMPVSSAILDQVLVDFPAVVEIMVKYQWVREIPDEVRQISRQKLLKNRPEVLYGDYVACHQFNGREKLLLITVPVLVLGATSDKMTPFPESEYLQIHLPQAQLVALAGAGHMLMLERPTAVAEAVSHFLAGL
jgi:pimeloyl-ACP methyl ester carboxylesterase